jgi:tetratricopeptide (TPR) repeat protein
MDRNPGQPDVEGIVQRGLRLYGAGQTRDAIECWRYALILSPGHPRALEYLEAAGASVSQGISGLLDDARTLEVPILRQTAEGAPSRDELLAVARGSAFDQAALSRVRELIHAGQLEDALAVLYAAHARSPRHSEISRVMQDLKLQLSGEYRAELGDLAAVPVQRASPRGMTASESEIFNLIDGVLAFDDIVQSSSLGAFQALRTLVQLLRHGMIERADQPYRIATLPRPLAADPAPATRPLESIRPRLEAVSEPSAAPPSHSLPKIPPPPRLLRLVSNTDPPPLREREPGAAVSPPPYAAVIAQAVQAYLRGQYPRARELVEECLRQIPEEDIVSRRDVERLRSRLGDKAT